MFEKILVPLDGSKLAERALAPALSLAESEKTEVVLLRVPEARTMLVQADWGHFEYDVLWPQQALDRNHRETHDYLQSVCETYRSPEVSVRPMVVEGDPASVILNEAIEEDFQLIVMSTHGHSGITRWLTGSVTEKVLRAAPCPVLVVRSKDPIRKVLIALDGSELSEKALNPGLELAVRLNGEVTLLRSVEDATVNEGLAKYLEGLGQGLGERVRQEPFTKAASYLDRAADAHATVGIDIAKVVPTGPASEQILDHAERHGSDLIVMATHGRSGIRRWVYGSVTDKVLRAGCCSMLIVPPRTDSGVELELPAFRRQDNPEPDRSLESGRKHGRPLDRPTS